jgi:hypothetical protein
MSGRPLPSEDRKRKLNACRSSSERVRVETTERKASGPPDPPKDWARTELLLGLFNHVEQQIGLGETRAGLLLAAGAAAAVVYMQIIKEMAPWGSLGPVARVLLVMAAVLLVLSVLSALWAVRPAWTVTRFGAGDRTKESNESMVEFASIASRDRKTFVEGFQSKSERGLQNDLLSAIHGKSLKARDKFTELYPAILCLSASIVLFAGAMLIPC